jgi:hypothetical protein
LRKLKTATGDMMTKRVAIIGSFKQHNGPIQEACAALRSHGFTVTSPRGSDIVVDGVDFVRFTSDPSTWSDPSVQSLALHRIFGAELVYVVAPGGYVGKTTCYEIGRILQRQQPLYFSESPKDLPIHVPERAILGTEDLIRKAADPDWNPALLFELDEDPTSELERQLIAENLRDD